MPSAFGSEPFTKGYKIGSSKSEVSNRLFAVLCLKFVIVSSPLGIPTHRDNRGIHPGAKKDKSESAVGTSHLLNLQS